MVRPYSYLDTPSAGVLRDIQSRSLNIQNESREVEVHSCIKSFNTGVQILVNFCHFLRMRSPVESTSTERTSCHALLDPKLTIRGSN